LGNGDFVATSGEHHLAFLAFDDCGSRVLAHGEYAARCDRGVLQQVEGDEAIVFACFRIIKNRTELCKV